MRAVACAVLSASAVTAKSMRSPTSQLSQHTERQFLSAFCACAGWLSMKTGRSRSWFSTRKLKSSLSDLSLFRRTTSFEFLCILPDELASVAFGLREQILKSFIRFGDRFVADLTKCRVELRFFFAKSCRRFSRKASCVWLTDRGHDRKSC